MQGLCVDYKAVQFNIYEECGRVICSQAYANSVKRMYTSASGHTVDCSEFICSIYIDIVVSHLHMGDCMVAVKVS